MTAATSKDAMTRHFLKDTDLSPAEQAEVLELAARMKAAPYSVQPFAAEGSGRKTVAVIFDKTSTRTRVSFATGIADMGGNALIINPGEAQIGHKESVSRTPPRCSSGWSPPSSGGPARTPGWWRWPQTPACR